MTSRRRFLATLALMGAPGALAQQRVRRIGYLSGSTPANTATFLAAFLAGMADLGWTEGRDYVLEGRWGGGVPEAREKLADELVAMRPDLLLSSADNTSGELAKRTATIPIVFAIGSDPVGAGLVASLKRPGRNVTGVMQMTQDLGPKRLELLREALPNVAHVAVLFEPNLPLSVSQVPPIEQAARRLGMRTTAIAMRNESEIEAAFKQAMAVRADAYIVVQGVLAAARIQEIAGHALRYRAPTIFHADPFPEAGGLMSYGNAPTDAYRKAASYVDKILKGANPGELPVEQPTRIDLVINMKTARAMGLTIRQSVLLRADRVIE